jgi:hypothetical protein
MKSLKEFLGTIWMRVSLSVALMASFAWALLVGVFPLAAATEAVTDAINSTVSLIQVLLVALLPLIILVALFSFIMGMFTGEHGMFSKLGGK